jgi:predicted RNase H-like HicB family nuclease
MKYLLVIETAANNLCAYFPDVPGCVTAGSTVEEVRRNAAEVLSGHLEGEEIPAARPLKAILDEGLQLDGTEVFAWVDFEPAAQARV